ncbi:Putative amidase domain-containing protein [Microbacterium sp. RU33B]|nr:Putative amidase domain-containing protein [Microbacterium sp. RU33B]
MFRRRRATVLLAIVLIVAAVIVIPRIAASAAAAETRSDLSRLLDVSQAALDASSSFASTDAVTALSDARSSALDPGESDEDVAAAATAMGAAVEAYRDAVVEAGKAVLGQWSDAERSTENALFAQITAVREAEVTALPAVLAKASDAVGTVKASAQAYRDSLTTAAEAASSQPTGGDLDAQIAYLLAYADDYNVEEWGDYNSAGGDCVNFTSQGLLARGWQMDDEWNSGGAWKASKVWRSTTAMDEYLSAQGFAVSTIDDLDRVRVGDVGVFDWGDTGPGLDHTMTVSRVEYSPDGPIISFASHNTDGQYRPMPKTLSDADSGSTMKIYSIP